MKFTVAERVRLIEILPMQGDYTTIKTVRELRESLGFDTDAEELGIKVGRHIWEDPRDVRETEEDYARRMALPHDEGTMCWRDSADQPKEVELSPKAVKVIVGALERMAREEKLTETYLPLYEKFIIT